MKKKTRVIGVRQVCILGNSIHAETKPKPMVYINLSLNANIDHILVLNLKFQRAILTLQHETSAL